MAVASARVEQLSGDHRRLLQVWLDEFERSWHPNLLSDRVQRLPPADSPVRLPALAELVKIRVSQLNGCAFCLRMHTRDALAAGETTDRLAVLAAWWESQYFTAQERTSRRAEWFNTYSFTPLGPMHLVKIGAGPTYESFDGVSRSRPVQIVRRA